MKVDKNNFFSGYNDSIRSDDDASDDNDVPKRIVELNRAGVRLCSIRLQLLWWCLSR